jgi:hypothetical protein
MAGALGRFDMRSMNPGAVELGPGVGGVGGRDLPREIASNFLSSRWSV